MTEEEEEELLEQAYLRLEADPMPEELKDAVGAYIEPYSATEMIDHADMVTGIELAWPLIKEYLQRGTNDVQERDPEVDPGVPAEPGEDQ